MGNDENLFRLVPEYSPHPGTVPKFVLMHQRKAMFRLVPVSCTKSEWAIVTTPLFHNVFFFQPSRDEHNHNGSGGEGRGRSFLKDFLTSILVCFWHSNLTNNFSFPFK